MCIISFVVVNVGFYKIVSWFVFVYRVLNVCWFEVKKEIFLDSRIGLISMFVFFYDFCCFVNSDDLKEV